MNKKSLGKTRATAREIIVRSIQHCQDNRKLKLFAYVIMPSHIHMVVQDENGKLNEILRDFKSFTAKENLKSTSLNNSESRREWMLYMFKYFAKNNKQNKEYMFWQKTNHPIELFTNEVIDQKNDYIHNNPVIAGIVTQSESYLFSSSNAESPIGVLAT